MHAVLFLFRPYPEHHGTYFDLVALLRPELAKIEGFLANERFSRPGQPGWLLSLSLWQDEAAILRWRSHAGHRVAQVRGRKEVFADYRLRVGEIMAADAMEPDLLRVTVGRGLSPSPGAEVFASITEEGRQLAIGGVEPGAEVERDFRLRVLRDYGPTGHRSSGTLLAHG